jgi:PBP1b-binding outer membrane lipoprotein LpoB
MSRVGSLLIVAWLCTGCARPCTTVMTAGDYEFIGAEIGGKLARQMAEGFLAGRSGDSPPMVIAIQKVVNYTSDMMSDGARWLIMSHVKGTLPIKSLARERNVRFVIPAEQLRRAKAEGTFDEEDFAERAPTHAMTATFRSATRSSGTDRTDLYYCEFQLTALETGEIAWTDRVEFKRIAVGESWD